MGTSQRCTDTRSHRPYFSQKMSISIQVYNLLPENPAITVIHGKIFRDTAHVSAKGKIKEDGHWSVQGSRALGLGKDQGVDHGIWASP